MKGIFDVKLYKEGLRTLKNFGIISLVLLSFISVVSVIGSISSSIERAAYSSVAPLEESYVTYTNIFDINPLLVLIFVIVAPFMTIQAFNFTTHRASSDFYFSIPKRRETIYFSFIISVVSWIFAILLMSAILPFLISLFFKKYIVINILASLKHLLDFFLSSLLVISAVLIAISVTGNMFSNIFVALLIIFVPRIFIIVLTALGLMTTNVVADIYSIPLCSPDINIPFGYIFKIFTYENSESSILPYIYTGLLLTVYFYIGSRLFKNRKSEAATKFAATNKLSAVFRITFSSVVMLIASSLLLIMYFEKDYSFLEVITAFACFVLSFIAYCVYEIITTKSIKRCIKVLPGFIVPILINISAVVIVLIINTSVLSFSPSPKDIKYVKITNDYADSNYITDSISQIKLDNQEVKEIISESLKENLESYKNNNYFYDTTSQEGKYTHYNVKINTGIITRERMIYVSNDKSKRITTALQSKKEFKQLFNTLPKPNDSTLSLYVYDSNFSGAFSEKETTALYTAMLKDIKEGIVSGAEIYESLTLGYYSENYPFSIGVNMAKGVNDYSLTLPITKKFTNCYNIYKDLVNKISDKNKDKVFSNIKLGKISVSIDDASAPISNYEKLSSILSKAKVGIDQSLPHTLVCVFEDYDEKTYEYIYYPVAYSITQDQFDEIQKIIIIE